MKKPSVSQTLATPQQDTPPEEKPKRELPIWCRGIMGGCVNCGGCV